MQPDRPAASATTHKSLIMFFLRARIVDGGGNPIRNEVCPNVTDRPPTFGQFCQLPFAYSPVLHGVRARVSRRAAG
jgi:hypothetical protein